MGCKSRSFAEGFATGGILVVIGVFLQFFTGPMDWDALAFPVNVFALAVFLVLLISVFVLRNKLGIFRLLTSIPSAVTSLTYAVLLTAVLGLARQVKGSDEPNDVVGITKMLSFWPFIFIYTWLATVVGLVTLKQLCHPTWHKVPSLLCHVGLFLFITAGTAGSADRQDLRMYCEMRQTETQGIDANNLVHELPFTLRLNQFILEEYPPRLAMTDKSTQQMLKKDCRPLTLEAQKGGQVGDWYVRPAQKGKNGMLFVSAECKSRARHVEGWMGCSSSVQESRTLILDKRFSLVMLPEEPKRFASSITVTSASGKKTDTTVEVNKPFSTDGWKIYQYGYDEQAGKFSNYSEFQLVRDPWLPAVYTGIALLLLGAVGLFFTPTRRKEGKP